jgi:hypothetical protein
MDASHYQTGGVTSHDGKPMAFYNRKLDDALTCYATTEHEILTIVETWKEYHNVLLWNKIEVFTNHQILVHKHFNTERVMLWRLILEEFGPTLTCPKRENKVVADTLSRLNTVEKESSANASMNDVEDFPEVSPLSYARIMQARPNNPELMDRCASSDWCGQNVALKFCPSASPVCE